jgi:hypothetical protein
MKAKLTFDLDDFDDREAHKRCLKSLDLCLLLWDLDKELRSRTKHAPDTATEEEVRVADEIRTTLFQLKEKYNIDLDELMS